MGMNYGLLRRPQKGKEWKKAEGPSGDQKCFQHYTPEHELFGSAVIFNEMPSSRVTKYLSFLQCFRPKPSVNLPTDPSCSWIALT
jgi:hypothetical protein